MAIPRSAQAVGVVGAPHLRAMWHTEYTITLSPTSHSPGATPLQQPAQTQPEPDLPQQPHQARELPPGVTADPRVMVGKPVIAGTRIPVEKITMSIGLLRKMGRRRLRRRG